jgi:hypothetical protein
VKYVLIDGKTAYKLSVQQSPQQYAGRQVRITGNLLPKTGYIEVHKIEVVK